MINYNKNDLIDACLERYYKTFSCTLDTADFVPQKYNDKILRYIFKNLKKQFRKLDKEDKLYQKSLIKNERLKRKKSKKSCNECLDPIREDSFDTEKQQLITQIISLIKQIKEQKENEIS